MSLIKCLQIVCENGPLLQSVKAQVFEHAKTKLSILFAEYLKDTRVFFLQINYHHCAVSEYLNPSCSNSALLSSLMNSVETGK
jgi:hypothetical protein